MTATFISTKTLHKTPHILTLLLLDNLHRWLLGWWGTVNDYDETELSVLTMLLTISAKIKTWIISSLSEKNLYMFHTLNFFYNYLRRCWDIDGLQFIYQFKLYVKLIFFAEYINLNNILIFIFSSVRFCWNWSFKSDFCYVLFAVFVSFCERDLRSFLECP